jgi:quercetin dioxygenase-like cupin family protein
MGVGSMFKKGGDYETATLLLLVAVFLVVGYSFAQQQVERKGVTSTVKLEGTDFGYLSQLNDKYKLRVTETIIEPGGYVGEHNHVGPGIRFLLSGELTFVEHGKTRTYKAGDYFYETGAITNRASNKGSSPVVNIIFEILPVDWKAGSAVPPKSQ